MNIIIAGVEQSDPVIAVTDADEINLLCCMTANGINPKIHTIARIRNPEYADQVMTMPEVFPLSMTVNPEKQADWRSSPFLYSSQEVPGRENKRKEDNLCES